MRFIRSAPPEGGTTNFKQRVDDARPEARLLRAIGQWNVFPTGVANGAASMGSSMAEHQAHNLTVTGSTPVHTTKRFGSVDKKPKGGGRSVVGRQ